MSRKYIALVSVLNKRLNHFPVSEQKGLVPAIRNKIYLMCDHMIDAQKRFPYQKIYSQTQHVQGAQSGARGQARLVYFSPGTRQQDTLTATPTQLRTGKQL